MVQSTSDSLESVFDTELPETSGSSELESDFLDDISGLQDLDVSSDDAAYFAETGSVDEDILLQLQVTNKLLGLNIGFQILFMVSFLVILLFRLIEKYVTNNIM